MPSPVLHAINRAASFTETIFEADADEPPETPEATHNRLAGEKYPTGNMGFGVRSRRCFAPGEVVMVFHGPILPPNRVPDFDLYLQLSPCDFMGSAGDIDDYINHSCDPNTVLVEQTLAPTPTLEGSRTIPCLVAVRPIVPLDPITFDYSITMSGRYWTMKCCCGASNCRQVVDDFDTLSRDLQVRLEQHRSTYGGQRARLLAEDLCTG